MILEPINDKQYTTEDPVSSQTRVAVYENKKYFSITVSIFLNNDGLLY